MFDHALSSLNAGLKAGLARLSGGPVWRGGPGDMVLVLDRDALIRKVSASADAIVGAGAGGLKGRSFYDFVRREDREAVRRALKASLEGTVDPLAAPRADFRLLRLRRAPSLCEISFQPGRGGRVTALVRARGQDLARLRAARAATAAAEEEARKTVAARDDLMADLGHELKTPLNAIMGFAETMREETFGPLGSGKYREYAELIHGSGAHLMELIGAILDAAKLEAGRYALEPAPVAPGPLARDCAEMIRGEAERAGLDLIVSIAPDLPEAMIDKRAVKQILINLLSNAVKFTATGGVSLSVSEKCGAIDFIVRDTGVGMDEEALSKLGGRFTEVCQTGVRGAKGAGLGLSLAFSLARLHGGALKLTSAPGEGTTARLTLPLRQTGGDDSIGDAEGAHADIQSQLDRVAAYRREREAKASAA